MFNGQSIAVPGLHNGLVFETVQDWIFIDAQGVGFKIRWNMKVGGDRASSLHYLCLTGVPGDQSQLCPLGENTGDMRFTVRQSLRRLQILGWREAGGSV